MANNCIKFLTEVKNTWGCFIEFSTLFKVETEQFEMENDNSTFIMNEKMKATNNSNDLKPYSFIH